MNNDDDDDNTFIHIDIYLMMSDHVISYCDENGMHFKKYT